jgi:hypothetical protein
MGVVREKTEFIIGKGITDKVSARENGSTKCRKKKNKRRGKDFILGCFYIILNLEKIHIAPCLQWPGEDLGTHAYTCANSQAPQIHEGRNFHSTLTKDLPVKGGGGDIAGLR